MKAEYATRTRDTMDETLFEALQNMVTAYSMVNIERQLRCPVSDN